MGSRFAPGMTRRTLVKAGASLGGVALAAPSIIKARGEEPIRIGFVDPITGIYSAFAQSEVNGAKLAVQDVNKKGGILGRPLELLVEDSANDTGTGVQKALKLIWSAMVIVPACNVQRIDRINSAKLHLLPKMRLTDVCQTRLNKCEMAICEVGKR